jgi:hypothetical protein|tara:strand:- start:603 stop:1019 length:417 start_codon:yes stop_codon:yes gene_type:complete
MVRDCAGEIDFARKPATGFAARDNGWDLTKRQAFDIAGDVVLAGTRRTVNIRMSTLSDHTPVTLSAHVVHGKKDGPVVFVSAGIHGDEVIGVEIVRRLLRRELQHMAWLEANMAGTALLDQCKLRLEKFKDSLSRYGQ